MKKIIQTEWWKLRRCQILLVGIVALALCPVVQYGTQLIVNPEIRDPNFDFIHLFANVVWGNTQVFLPHLAGDDRRVADRPGEYPRHHEEPAHRPGVLSQSS